MSALATELFPRAMTPGHLPVMLHEVLELAEQVGDELEQLSTLSNLAVCELMTGYAAAAYRHGVAALQLRERTTPAGGLHALAAVKPTGVRAVPNPAIGSTSFMFDLPRAAKARVQVFNLVGEKLWDRTVAGKQGANTLAFDAAQLESGVYLYTVEAGGHTFTSRLVVN